jgi:hypothetical protein
MLIVVMLIVVMLIVIMVIVIMLNVIMPNVVAPSMMLLGGKDIDWSSPIVFHHGLTEKEIFLKKIVQIVVIKLQFNTKVLPVITFITVKRVL